MPSGTVPRPMAAPIRVMSQNWTARPRTRAGTRISPPFRRFGTGFRRVCERTCWGTPRTMFVMSEHELHRFMWRLTAELADEYERIRDRTRDDPGTAGDEGEENWASLLRRWLPAGYHITTKGRLLSHDGKASPQVDVVVLSPAYPPVLRDTKLYLLEGVTAAFECKTTLRAGHLADAAERCRTVKRMASASASQGTLWKETRGGVMYGLLAHSHDWKQPGSTPKENIGAALHRDLHEVVSAPREMLDLVCVADVSTWHSSASVFLPYMLGEHWPAVRDRQGLPNDGGIQGLLFEQEPLTDTDDRLPAPVGVALATIWDRLAQQDESMRPIAEYFRQANLYGSGAGSGRSWRLEEALSDDVRRRLLSRSVPMNEQGMWGEWRQFFF